MQVSISVLYWVLLIPELKSTVTLQVPAVVSLKFIEISLHIDSSSLSVTALPTRLLLHIESALDLAETELI